MGAGVAVVGLEAYQRRFGVVEGRAVVVVERSLRSRVGCGPDGDRDVRRRGVVVVVAAVAVVVIVVFAAHVAVSGSAPHVGCCCPWRGERKGSFLGGRGGIYGGRRGKGRRKKDRKEEDAPAYPYSSPPRR
jgi:hypothetical protein